MRASFTLALTLSVFISNSAVSAEETPAAGSTYANLPKDRFGAVEYTITTKDMMLDSWVVDLNSSANTIQNKRNSYAKNVRQFTDINRSFLGVRIKYPTHRHNAYARIAPQYNLPAFDARGYPINYGFFDPQADGVNPFKSGASAAPGTSGDPAFTTYSPIPRVPGIKTLIDFNDYEKAITNVAGYVYKRYLDNMAGRAAENGMDTGMPVIGFALDPDGGVDAKVMRQLTEIGYIFADSDATRDKDAYAASIKKALGDTSPPAVDNRPKLGQAPSHKQVATALDAIEAVAAAPGATGGAAAAGAGPLSKQISYSGVVHNAAQIKEIVVRVAGRNYRNGLAIRLRNENEEVSEYFLGYLDFAGWQYRRWINPSYLPAEEAEPFRLPLYPTEIPYLAFDSFVVYRNGTEIGGDFVTYFDWVKLDYDLAVPPAQLEVGNADFIDVDDDGWWKILRDRNAEKTRKLMQKFSAAIDLKRQQIGRSVRQAEGIAPVETQNYDARNTYKEPLAGGGTAAPAPAGGGGGAAN